MGAVVALFGCPRDVAMTSKGSSSEAIVTVFMVVTTMKAHSILIVSKIKVDKVL